MEQRKANEKREKNKVNPLKRHTKRRVYNSRSYWKSVLFGRWWRQDITRREGREYYLALVTSCSTCANRDFETRHNQYRESCHKKKLYKSCLNYAVARPFLNFFFDYKQIFLIFWNFNPLIIYKEGIIYSTNWEKQETKNRKGFYTENMRMNEKRYGIDFVMSKRETI